jgi:perosamine synthetase
MGPAIAAFERRLAALAGRRYAVALASGTAALDVALKVLGIEPGDEVIVPALAYIATPNAVTYQNARLVLADVRPHDWMIDPDDAARRVTSRTRAIIALDYGGIPADYDALLKLARAHGLALVADGAQSLGASVDGRWTASFGVVAITSFHTIKTPTTVEGGMLFTDDPQLAQAARLLRDQGEDPQEKYRHLVVGYNYRLSDLNAAIGLAQLARLPQLLAARRALAAGYRQRLAGLPVELLYVPPGSEPSWFLFSILVKQRDAIRRFLSEHGIETRISWPLPVHRQPCYRALSHLSYPVAEKIAAHVLSLPLYVGLRPEQQDEICAVLAAALQQV